MADLGDDRARHKRRSSRLPWFLHRPTAAARRRSAIKIEDALREAISVAREPSAKLWELRATMSLARLFFQQNKRAKGRAMLADIYGCSRRLRNKRLERRQRPARGNRRVDGKCRRNSLVRNAVAENCEGAKFRDRCGAEEALSLVELSGAVRGAAH